MLLNLGGGSMNANKTFFIFFVFVLISSVSAGTIGGFWLGTAVFTGLLAIKTDTCIYVKK